jgi:peptidylprolyl isomerase
MATVGKGDTVLVHFTGKLEDGTEFISSKGQEPLRLTLGQGQFLPGFEEELLGMSAGESKTATLSPEQGFGPRREDQVMTVERSRIPPEIDLQIGAQLNLRGKNDDELRVVVTGLTEKGVTLDANHPLAGKQLKFEIKLVEIA